MRPGEDFWIQLDGLQLLSTPRTVLAGLRRLTPGPRPDLVSLTRTFGLDPSLCASLLRDASRRGTPAVASLPTIEAAAGLVGAARMAELLSLATAGGSSGTLDTVGTESPPAGSLDTTHRIEETRPDCWLWGHSLGTALACRLLAERIGHPNPAAGYLAGLLHDLGKIALWQLDRTKLRQIRHLALKERVCFAEAERRASVPGHTEVGRRLARSWGLHPALQDVICYHHEATSVLHGYNGEVARLADLVVVGDGMARRHALGSGLDGTGSPAWGALTRERLGLRQADLQELGTELKRRYQQAVGLVLENPPSLTTGAGTGRGSPVPGLTAAGRG